MPSGLAAFAKKNPAAPQQAPVASQPPVRSPLPALPPALPPAAQVPAPVASAPQGAVPPADRPAETPRRSLRRTAGPMPDFSPGRWFFRRDIVVKAVMIGRAFRSPVPRTPFI